MKKLFFLLALATIGTLTTSYAQNAPAEPTVIVCLGDICPHYKDGKIDNITTTRSEILANTTLSTPPPFFKVVEFSFSMLPKAKDFLGPFKVTGDKLTPEIIKLIQNMDDPQGRIFIENIIVNVNGIALKATPLALKMALKK